MAEISSLSTIPSVEQLVDRFAAKERQPVKTFESKKSSLNRRRAVLSDLKSKLKSLRTRVKGFTDVGTAAKLAAKTAVSSDTSIFTVKADATAAIGVNTIFISRIAKNDLAVSKGFKKTETTIAQNAVGTTQKFTIQIGSGTTKTISIAFNSASESNSDALSRIAEAINNNVDDVTAKVISSTKSKNRLTLVTNDSGSENEISLKDIDSTQLLQTLGIINDASGTRKAASKTQGGFITVDTEDLDAVFTINGIEITSSSNSVTDVLRGVTIQLRKAQKSSSDPETFTISQNTETTKEQIEDFIKEYNDALKFLTEKTAIDTKTGKRGSLASNFVYTNLRLKLREIVSQRLAGVESGKPSQLTAIGIAIGSNGTLSIDDSDKLESAITENASAVTDLFTNDSGIAAKLVDLLDTYTLAGKAIDKDIKSIRQQNTSIDRQITQFESRFRFREESLRRKFTELERALTLLNSQQTALQRFGFSSNILFQFGNVGIFGQNRSLF